MFVPEPVISLSLKPKEKNNSNFGKALNRFQKEDPTFRVHVDPESQEVSALCFLQPPPLLILFLFLFPLFSSKLDYYFRNG